MKISRKSTGIAIERVIRVDGTRKRFFRHNTWQHIGVAGMIALWLYLFLPFRPFGIPIYFGQVEEWTLTAVILTLICLILFVSFYRRRPFILHITLCDVLMLLYVVYILFRLEEYLLRQDYILQLFTITLLYVILRIMDVRYLHYIIPVLVVSLLFQLFEAFYRHDYTWSRIPEIKGLFHNTGIWGCFAGIVSVAVYGVLLFARRNKVLLSVVFFLSTALLIYSQSRAAWIGATTGIVWLSLVCLWKKYGAAMIRLSLISVLLSAPLFVYAVKKTYMLKPVSADGRFYIWKISSQILSENPLLGIGVDKYKSRYMYYQADYFSKNPDSPFTQIADDINVPFSEPLKTGIEQGIIGLVLFSAIIITTLIPALNVATWGNESSAKKDWFAS